MKNDRDNPSTKRMPIGDLQTEPGSEDLLDSPAMEPYRPERTRRAAFGETVCVTCCATLATGAFLPRDLVRILDRFIPFLGRALAARPFVS